jgi:hypothetical protein
LKSTKSKKQAWLKGLLDSGVKPELMILDEVPIKEWEFWEIHYISLCKSWGFRLTNMTNGGECGSGIAWNKGLTKEMDERVKLYGIRGRWKRGRISQDVRINSYNNYERLKGEKHPMFGKHFSFESKAKMCLTKKARVFKVTKDY